MLAAAAFNFKRIINKIRICFWRVFEMRMNLITDHKYNWSNLNHAFKERLFKITKNEKLNNLL